MPAIEYLESHVVYENPRPHVHSRHGYFPGLALLPSGELIALFVIAEAFEAPNGTTWVARSRDDGRTWTLQGPLYHKAVVGFETTDSLKPTLLRDGSLIATGYRFHRHDPEMPIAIPETGGILPGDDIVSFSSDEGRTWTVPAIIARSHPELLEISGPCIESRRSGDLLAVAAPYRMPDGSNPSGQIGVLVRSRDKGRTWDDTARYFTTPGNRITPFEGRICEMQEGRLVALVWAYDAAADAHLANHVAVSHDDGRTWSSPAPTPHHGQASNLLWLGEDLLLTIHAHRGGATPASTSAWWTSAETRGSRSPKRSFSAQAPPDRRARGSKWPKCSALCASASPPSSSWPAEEFWPRTGPSRTARAASGRTACACAYRRRAAVNSSAPSRRPGPARRSGP